MEYTIEKNIWTEADFDRMGWHDNRIYKMRLTENLELDIDYILKWNQPDIEGLSFTFWIAPATLIFKNPANLSFEFDTAYSDYIEIEDIERQVSGSSQRWTIVTHQGDFEFTSPGYTQFIRQPPFFKFGQVIDYDERHGLSQEQTVSQNNPNRFREDIIARRNKELVDYEIVKKRYLKRREAEELERQREASKLDLKTYLIRKREIRGELDNYDHLLKDSGFA